MYIHPFFLHAAFDRAKAAALGEDRLRGDADADAAWQKVHASARPVSLLLMDQSVIAGVGNIYRCARPGGGGGAGRGLYNCLSSCSRSPPASSSAAGY